ncbi:MAG: endonuclease/exonuclease/phosphatase family protein, partial [Pseudomonadota bacterium]
MRLFLALLMLASGAAAQSDLRVATYNLSFNRSGPGILLKDLQAGEDPQIAAATEVIASVRPDILLLNEFDYDGGNAALEVFRATLAESGLDYPYAFAAPSNTGEPSGIDLNADGEIAGPGDAFGFGQFPGQFGMAVLSRHPIDIEATRTFQTLLWSDLPGALRPVAADGTPFPSEASLAAMRLSSKSHWDVAVETPSGPLRLFASHPTPPVFDGP